MKKLIVSVAAVLVGLAANATAVNWSAQQIMIDGDTGAWEGTMAPANWQVYLFDGVGAYDSVQAALASGKLDGITTALAGAVTTKTGADGSFSQDGATSQTGTFNTFAVIIDAASLDKANWAFLVEQNAFTIGNTAIDAGLYNEAGGGSEYAGYIGAVTYGEAGNGWYKIESVPEPTSGLLLLLGVAGLALRRRRA